MPLRGMMVLFIEDVTEDYPIGLRGADLCSGGGSESNNRPTNLHSFEGRKNRHEREAFPRLVVRAYTHKRPRFTRRMGVDGIAISISRGNPAQDFARSRRGRKEGRPDSTRVIAPATLLLHPPAIVVRGMARAPRRFDDTRQGGSHRARQRERTGVRRAAKNEQRTTTGDEMAVRCALLWGEEDRATSSTIDTPNTVGPMTTTTTTTTRGGGGGTPGEPLTLTPKNKQPH